MLEANAVGSLIRRFVDVVGQATGRPFRSATAGIADARRVQPLCYLQHWVLPAPSWR